MSSQVHKPGPIRLPTNRICMCSVLTTDKEPLMRASSLRMCKLTDILATLCVHNNEDIVLCFCSGRVNNRSK